jgi:hypothetical protein
MGMVFPVEIWIDDEEALTERLAAVQQWLSSLPFRAIYLSLYFPLTGCPAADRFSRQGRSGSICAPIRRAHHIAETSWPDFPKKRTGAVEMGDINKCTETRGRL